MGNSHVIKKDERNYEDEKILIDAIQNYINKMVADVHEKYSNREKILVPSNYRETMEVFLSKSKQHVESLIKFIIYSFSNLRYTPAATNGRHWYLAPDISEADRYNINDIRTHYTLPNLINLIICQNVNISAKFTTPIERELLILICGEEQQSGSLISSQVAKFFESLFTDRIIKLINLTNLNSLAVSTTVQYLKDGNNIDNIILLGSSIDILRKNINGYLTDNIAKDRELMFDLLTEAHNIDRSVTNMLILNGFNLQHHSMILKGGNVYKLYLENTLRDIQRNTLKVPDFMANLVNTELLPESQLSDWDFSLDMQGITTTYNGVVENMSATTNKIFESNDPQTYIMVNNNEIKARIKEYLPTYNAIINHIKEKLADYRNRKSDFWNAQADINAKNFNTEMQQKGLHKLQCQPAKSVTDVCVTYQKEREGDGNNNDSRLRSEELYATKQFDEFKTVFNNHREQIEQKSIENTCLKIVDMEVYSLEDKIINGFDLLRFSAKYKLSLQCTDNITLNFNCISEVFDFSHAKPCCVEYFFHGDANKGDFQEVCMIYLEGEICMQSYSLFWFVKDIVRMAIQMRYGPKFSKRAKRLYNALLMIIIKDSNSDMNTTTHLRNFITNPIPFGDYNSNLPTLLKTNIINELIQHDPGSIKPYYTNINQVLIEMLAKFHSDWVI